MKKNEYVLYNSKVVSNKNIAIVSDLHISENTPNKKLEEVLDTLDDIHPTHIVIPGDLYNVDTSTICENKVTNFVEDMTSIAETFYVKGNTEDMGSILNMSIFPNGIKENKKFHILGEDEKIVHYDGINITGIKIPEELYKKEEKRKMIELLTKYEEYLNRISKKCGDKDYNILLCHDPIMFEVLKIIEGINGNALNIDLLVAGHNHGGMFPKVLKPIINPFTNDINKYYPSYVNGLWETDTNNHMIVSEGVTKYHSEMGILENLERFHNGTIENVRILKK